MTPYDRDWIPTIPDNFIQEHLKQYMYGNLSSELKLRNLAFPVPREHFPSYLIVRLRHGPFSRTGFLKYRLNVPVRRLNRSVQIVRVNFVDFFVGSNLVCSGKGWFRLENDYKAAPLALIVDREAWFVIPRIMHLFSPNYLNCDHVVCEIQERAQKELLQHQPCLSAIVRDLPVHAMEQACSIPCWDWNKSGNIPSVIKYGDKLRISRISNPVHVECLNSNYNQILEPPPSGALEIPGQCDCKLLQNGRIFWTMPACASAANHDVGGHSRIYQLVPSAMVILRHTRFDFSNLSQAELESKVFVNVSGHLWAVEVLNQRVEVQKKKETQSWFALKLTFLNVLASWWMYRHWNFRQEVANFWRLYRWIRGIPEPHPVGVMALWRRRA